MMAVPGSATRRARSSLDPTLVPGTDEVSSRLVERLLESFFGRPIVCLLPLVVLLVLGGVAVANTERQYASSGVLSVANQTLLADLTNMRVEGFGWETPAAVTARRINELMGTDEFASIVVREAGLEAELDAGVLDLDDVRASISAGPVGSNLVRIRATSPAPEHALWLADAVFASFVDWLVEGDVTQSAAAEQFFAGLLERYEQEVIEARTGLEAYLAANPSGAAPRPATQRAEIDRLTTTLELAQDRYGSAVAGIQEAQLATEQTMSDVAQRIQVVDSPQLPYAPESSRRDMAVTLGMYLAIGLFFSGALVAIGAALDRTIRSVGDVRDRLGQRIVTVVPDAGAAKSRR
jgi:hypothetical protein